MPKYKLNEAVCDAHFLTSANIFAIGKFLPKNTRAIRRIHEELPRPTADLKQWVRRVSTHQARAVTGIK